MALPRRQVHLSTFELENDSIIGPSVFLEDADRRACARRVTARAAPQAGCSCHEALAGDPVESSRLSSGEAAGVADACAPRGPKSSAVQFHGAAASYQPGGVQRELARALPAVPVPFLRRARARVSRKIPKTKPR